MTTNRRRKQNAREIAASTGTNYQAIITGPAEQPENPHAAPAPSRDQRIVRECTDPDTAFLHAQWLLAGARVDEPLAGIGEYWTDRAAALLTPLLRAAGLAGLDLEAVTAWVATPDKDEPEHILAEVDERAAGHLRQVRDHLRYEHAYNSTNVLAVVAHALDSGFVEPKIQRLPVRAPAGQEGEQLPVIGPPSDRLWNAPGSGTEDRFPRWQPSQRRREAATAIKVPDGRARHLAGRWTKPRRFGEGNGYYTSKDADLLSLLYAVIVWERPGLRPTRDSIDWLMEQAEDLRVLGLIDAQCHELDRAARMLAGQHSGDARHSHGTIERIAAYLDSPIAGQTDAYVRHGWHELNTDAVHDSEGYAHVLVPWDRVRAILDNVLIRATGGYLPATPVQVRSGQFLGEDSYVETAWWTEGHHAPTGYRLSHGNVPHGMPFDFGQLDANPPDRRRRGGAADRQAFRDQGEAK